VNIRPSGFHRSCQESPLSGTIDKVAFSIGHRNVRADYFDHVGKLGAAFSAGGVRAFCFFRNTEFYDAELTVLCSRLLPSDY
jgi:hypothetical protein